MKSIKISSVTALRAAVAELATKGIKIELQEGGTPRAYFANQAGMGQADFVIKLADAKYDIGLYKSQDGTYEARTDFWGSSIESILGAKASSKDTTEQAKMGKLFQMYGIHAATEAARKKGHMVRRINREDGTVALEVSGPNL